MGTLPEWWTGPYPEVSSTRSATDYLDGLGAAITRKQQDGGWVLATGEQELVTAATPDELDSFVLGFALAHLICERHGLIGQRSGPVPVPHPADIPAAPPAADTPSESGDRGEEEGKADGAGDDEGDAADGAADHKDGGADPDEADDARGQPD